MKYLLVWGALSLGLGFSFTNRFHSNADNLIKSKNTSVNVNQISKDLTSSSEVNKLTNTINSKVGIIVVDHGSKRDEANKGLEKLVLQFKTMLHEDIVEPAHMELAEPSIATAYQRCVEQGATRIICYPYFLSKGRHVVTDIPALLETASQPFPTVPYLLTTPLGLEPEILDIMCSSVKRVIDSS